MSIRVAVTGAAGRMGREVVRAVSEADGIDLVAAIDHNNIGEDAGDLAGIGATGVTLRKDLQAALADSRTDVMIDFTVPDSAMGNVRAAVDAGVSPVIGTTGLGPADIEQVRGWCAESRIGALIAPNFAIGAVLMMRFAAEAAKYLPDAEIIELHHENKVDSPSGTALLTARMIAGARGSEPKPDPEKVVVNLPGARGAVTERIRIHSVRLPGHVAHQEVIFGGLGQTLTIRHDSLDRRSFMPGVVLAVRKVRELDGLAVGLEHLLSE